MDVQAADIFAQAVAVVWVVVAAHAVAFVLVLATAMVALAGTVLLIGAPQVTAMVVQAQACHYYLWPPEMSLPSDLLHRVLNA